MFENIQYGSYPRNANFDDLPIAYEFFLFTEQPIDCLTDNTVERLKVGLIGQSLDDITYKINPQNDDFDDLPFDGNERFITIWRLYRMDDNIIFRLKNGSSFDV